MSSFIKNQASITYNNIVTKSCPVVTKVEPTIGVTKTAHTIQHGVVSDSGTVGKDRVIVYEILLVNYSSKNFNNIVIHDTVSLSDSQYTTQAFDYDLSKSTLPNAATPEQINQIILDVGALPSESKMQIYYTLHFNDDVALGTTISNKALVDYTENPKKDPTSGAHIPEESPQIDIVVSYTETSIVATKEAPDAILCGDTYAYTLSFTNTGDQVASDIYITDALPAEFDPNLSLLTITNNGESIDPSDYNAIIGENHTLVITNVEGGTKLNILPDTTLVVVIHGTHVLLAF